MGNVYLGEHVSIKRKVAIKVLKPELVKNEEIRKRFKNEASMLAHLQHPNIVGLIDYVEQEDGLYLIMEYVDGQGLDELIKTQQAPISIERANKLMIQVLQAFMYAHKNGVVHRDVKPSNILVTADDQLKVLDFGIAKLVGDNQHHLTKTGTQIGTVYYMSPEQVKGQDLDQRSDIYSLGVTFYELLSGVCPYRGMTTEYEIYDNIVNEPLLALTHTMGNAYARVWEVIAKATDKDVRNRFQDCDTFIKALEQGVLSQPRTEAKTETKKVETKKKTVEAQSSNSKTWLITAMIVFGIGVLGFLLFWKSAPTEVKWRIEAGFVEEGEEYSINFAYYTSENDSLLPYQIKVNELIRDFVLDYSFVSDSNSFYSLPMNMDFFKKVLIDSKANSDKQFPEFGSSIHDSIYIDTNFNSFDQVVMSMYGYQGGGTGWQAIRYHTIDKETSKVLGLQDFVSNIDIFTDLAEKAFRKQMGLRESEDFGDQFTFENDVFYCPINFYLAEGNFIFSYEKYEITIGAAGSVTFKVPISEVSHLLTRDLSTKTPMNIVAPVEAEIQVEELTTEFVNQKMLSYYGDLIYGNFDANNYYAENVDQYIMRTNLTPEDINEINQTNTEFTQKNIFLEQESTHLDHITGDKQYWNYMIYFTCYRASKGLYQSCNVRIEVGFDADNKMVSYKELEVTDLEFMDYNPAEVGD